MEEKYKVIKVNDSTLTLGCDKKACDECKSQMFCSNKINNFEALNPSNISFKEDDEAVVDIPEGKATLSSVISLLIPLLLFVPFYFIGRNFTQNEVFLALWGLGGIALGFVGAAIFFHYKKRAFTPVVIRKEDKE